VVDKEEPSSKRGHGDACASAGGVWCCNFSRLPRLVCYAATSFLLVLVAHYVDDFPSVDVEAGGAMSSRLVLALHVRDMRRGRRRRHPERVRRPDGGDGSPRRRCQSPCGSVA